MMKFEVVADDKEDLKNKVKVNLEADDKELDNWKGISSAMATLIETMPEPGKGTNKIRAKFCLDAEAGSMSLDVCLFATNFGSPMGYY